MISPNVGRGRRSARSCIRVLHQRRARAAERCERQGAATARREGIGVPAHCDVDHAMSALRLLRTVTCTGVAVAASGQAGRFVSLLTVRVFTKKRSPTSSSEGPAGFHRCIRVTPGVTLQISNPYPEKDGVAVPLAGEWAGRKRQFT